MGRYVVTLAALVAAALPAPALGASGTVSRYVVELTGSAEVPAGPAGATGEAVITLKPDRGEVCWLFRDLRGLGGKPTSAHIHKGKAGAAGNVVLPLGQTYARRGCVDAAKALIRRIQRAPKAHYVNVHNAAYPAGAVRGQLKGASQPGGGGGGYAPGD